MKQSKIYELNDLDFINIVKNSTAYSDVLRSLGLTTKGGNSSKLLKKRINELNIDVSHFDMKSARANIARKIELKDILVKNSSYSNISCLKKRLVNENKLEYKCAMCNNDGTWNGKELTLQLDHVNGVNNDNRIENLRFLCPNCHSQTSTYSGRNSRKEPELCKECGSELKHSQTGLCNDCSHKARRKVDRPSKEELQELIKTHSYVSLGKKFNVSDNAIRKWCKSYNII